MIELSELKFKGQNWIDFYTSLFLIDGGVFTTLSRNEWVGMIG